ncbi:MAG: hypothetical protein EBQ71_02715 [Betaproteobacteria bacterium]|nr:hypothetical protein [Betaproteobacteria bacterium]
MRLQTGEEHRLETGDRELCLVLLSGYADVQVGSTHLRAWAIVLRCLRTKHQGRSTYRQGKAFNCAHARPVKWRCAARRATIKAGRCA